MLKAHFDAVEQQLLATSQIPANTGHNLHKGTPRESFIKGFLENHLSEKVALGSGEIIDSNSVPGEQRNQIDIVVHRREYPKLDFGGQIRGYLAESVVATIEVKSQLSKEEFKKACATANAIKRLNRHLQTAMQIGYLPPSILCYLVAYGGPAGMGTIYQWIPEIMNELNIAYPPMPDDIDGRYGVVCPVIDAVFVLGKGFLHFDSSPIGILPNETRRADPQIKWVFSNTPSGNLLMLFLMLSQAVSGHSASMLNPLPYLTRVQFPGLGVGH